MSTSDTLVDAINIQQMADAALSDAQRAYLDSLPAPLRKRAYQRVKAALHTSARLQLAYCSQVGIAQVALERLVKAERVALEAEECRGGLAGQLIQKGATLPMLQTVLGMGKQEFAAIRKGLGGTGPATRKGVDDAESVRIYRLWESLGKPSDAGGFLELHKASGQNLRLLWDLVQDWQYANQQRGTGKHRKGNGG